MEHVLSLTNWMAWTRLQIGDSAGFRLQLFKTDGGIAVKNDRNVLLRHPDMDRFYGRVITEVRHASRYCGIIYLMYWLDETGNEIPLYYGKAEKYGRDGAISKNLSNKTLFGRWGYPKYYHIGELSNSLRELARTGSCRGGHSNWASKLFQDASKCRLARQVYFWASPWTHQDSCPCGFTVNVAELESCLLRHARLFFTLDNLNKQPGVNSCRCVDD